MSRILQAYPKEVFRFSENFLEVCFDYDSDYFQSLTEDQEDIIEQALPKTSDKTSDKIVALIGEDLSITIEKLSECTGITTRSVERNLRKLQKNNRIRRIGPKRGGYWEVIE